MVHEDPKKLILFGAACSPVTDQIAKAAKHWNLVQVKHPFSLRRFLNKIKTNILILLLAFTLLFYLFKLTYADTHPMFTAKSFPHFFRVVPSDNEFNPPRLSIMRNYNWTRVGTLYQNEAKYALVIVYFNVF